MKKIISIILVSTVLLFITGCDLGTKKDPIVDDNKDALLIRKEYESLNNSIREKDGKTITTIYLSESNPFVYTNADEIIEKIKNKDSFVVYFGFSDCPWCRSMITVLESAAKKTGIKEVYYFDLKDENKEDIRDVLSLDENGNIVSEKEGSTDYNKLLEELNDSLDIYEGLNDESIKRIYAPTVLFIQDGKVIGKHVGTLDSQKDPYILLNDEQVLELENIYEDYIHKMLNDLCDDKC